MVNVQSDRELVNTRRKLAMLENSLEAVRSESFESEHLREVEMESLKRLINQLKEEIARHEANAAVRA